MEKDEIILICDLDIQIKEFVKAHVSRKLYRSLKRRNSIYYVNDVLTPNYYKTSGPCQIKIILDKECVDNDNWLPTCPCPILFSNENILIVYKKRGLLTIPTRNEDDSLYQEVLAYYIQNNIKANISFINRLDKETEGLVLVAKNKQIAGLLNQNKKSINRYYLAKVEGVIEPAQGRVEIGISKMPTSTLRYVSDSGKKSITNYETIEILNDNTSIVKFHLETGRTHQIRLTCKYLAHSIVGDEFYGTKNKGLCLTSYKLEFIEPLTKEHINVEINPCWR